MFYRCEEFERKAEKLSAQVTVMLIVLFVQLR